MNVYRLTEAERKTYHRYAGIALPRHTSYPIVPAWTAEYGPADLRADLHRSSRESRPLSLYVHVPFCARLCYFCTCNREVVPEARRIAQDPGNAFLDALEIETDRFGDIVGPGEVRQIHLGGGTPTFLRPDQLRRLWVALRHHFWVSGDAEMAVELDPRATTLGHLETLRELGFNRASLGVQDFAAPVQRAVNRLQPFEQVEHLVDQCRSLGFQSINFDLIYGLPFQTRETMADTLEKTIALGPDRVAFYRLAVIPELFRWQNVFRHADLPSADLTLDLNLLAINRFQEAGYEFVGLDHFARPTEALARARRAGSLRRTFQGMTTGQGLDILGLGPSAVSQLDDAYAQNRKGNAAGWQQAVAHDLATERGVRLTEDDRLRRELLQHLYGYGVIDKRALEERFGITFDAYFADELQRLQELVGEGLVVVEADAVRLAAPLGRLLVRVVAAVFDRYLPPDAFREGLARHQSSRVG
jgi:oxygen-independent coproporphyrinogen-3 oxidase